MYLWSYFQHITVANVYTFVYKYLYVCVFGVRWGNWPLTISAPSPHNLSSAQNRDMQFLVEKLFFQHIFCIVYLSLWVHWFCKTFHYVSAWFFRPIQRAVITTAYRILQLPSLTTDVLCISFQIRNVKTFSSTFDSISDAQKNKTSSDMVEIIFRWVG